MSKKYCIMFAGPIGSGKSPIANYLSYKLNIPVFNNDLIRTEVQEDLLHKDDDEYNKRREERIKEILHMNINFIYDASVDRKWSKYKPVFVNKNYLPILISLDLSKDKLIQIWNAKGYTEFTHLDRTIIDHELFLSQFKSDVTISITNENFNTRLEDALHSVQRTLIIQT